MRQSWPNQTFRPLEPACPFARTRTARCMAISIVLSAPNWTVRLHEPARHSVQATQALPSALNWTVRLPKPSRHYARVVPSTQNVTFCMSEPTRHGARAVPSPLLRIGPSVMARCVGNLDRAIGSEPDLPSTQTCMARCEGQSQPCHLPRTLPSICLNPHGTQAVPFHPPRTGPSVC